MKTEELIPQKVAKQSVKKLLKKQKKLLKKIKKLDAKIGRQEQKINITSGKASKAREKYDANAEKLANIKEDNGTPPLADLDAITGKTKKQARRAS